ncbi:hypothetical protein CDV49_10305 [Haematobacter genomosp. 1]|uniref:Uncharacterized protein n=1 Tax=Haematobacter genomosp. 1 TaxID=366618 RepID=A0A212ABC1_9RHOB|nr:hypothetical protein CDV49_10305 [Haematobacter genomosp. 1]
MTDDDRLMARGSLEVRAVSARLLRSFAMRLDDLRIADQSTQPRAVFRAAPRLGRAAGILATRRAGSVSAAAIGDTARQQAQGALSHRDGWPIIRAGRTYARAERTAHGSRDHLCPSHGSREAERGRGRATPC